MIGVKQINHIDIEILLQPNDIAFRAMEDLVSQSKYGQGLDSFDSYLDNVRVCEDLVQVFKLFSHSQGVDNKVLVPRADLH